MVKDLMLSLLWHRFHPWPGNFHMLRVRPKKKNAVVRRESKNVKTPQALKSAKNYLDGMVMSCPVTATSQCL